MVEGRGVVAWEGAGAWQRARASLARRGGFRVARLGLLLVATLAIYAPFLASDRPLYLEAVHRGDFERARRTLVPVAEALVALEAESEEGFRAARASGSLQELGAARAAERAALRVRLAVLRAALGPSERAAVEAFERELEAGHHGGELPARTRELCARLDPEGVTLVARRSFPLLADLTRPEAGLAVAWLFVLAWPLLRRRWPGWRLVLLAGFAGLLAAGLWRPSVGHGQAFHTASYKQELTRGGIQARRVLFAPIPYGLAEQHPEESLRPPTWLAASELDERGSYLRGARVPRPDPVTGFVPATRPVEVRAGEPARNSAWRHVLGTDTTGRDLAARLIHGSRVSLGVGGLAMGLMLALGLLIGAPAGYFGGALDLVLSRVIEIVVSFPLLFLALVAVAFVGPSFWNVVLVLGGVGWTGVARLARSEFQRQRELDYVSAARALGYSPLRIMLRHVLPNTLAPLFVAATFAVAAAILVEAALSFLGYGVPVPTPSWGSITSESRDLSNWWLLVFPGAILVGTVLCVQLLGDALRDALDPRQAGGGVR